MILKQLNRASRRLAELKGVVSSIPNQDILINTLGLQEAKDSTEIENVVTTHDELYRDEVTASATVSAATKEVLLYRQALDAGFQQVRDRGLITSNLLCEVQAVLTGSNAGFRTFPGTTLRNSIGEVVYTPPQDGHEIVSSLSDLERFINDEAEFDADPLIKMALIHHQFESIHPFYDGNGRTGRILNVLYLTKESLLDIPVLNLSRPLVQNKAEYSRLLQAVPESDAWEDWIIFMLTAVELAAVDGADTISKIKTVLQESKQRIRDGHKFYSQDLINHLFSHPYTKIDLLMDALDISRLTATRYLDELVTSEILSKSKIGRSNYYVNKALWSILAGEDKQNRTS